MAVIDIKEGDTLRVRIPVKVKTNLGEIQEISYNFKYKDLIEKLSTNPKSKRSLTPGSKFSRVISLNVNAIEKGVWSNGTKINRDEIFERFLLTLDSIPEKEYKNITSKGLARLNDLWINNQPIEINSTQTSFLANLATSIKNSKG